MSNRDRSASDTPQLFGELVSAAELDLLIDRSLSEDVGRDVTGLRGAALCACLAEADVTTGRLPIAPTTRGAFVARQGGVIAGLPIVCALATRLGEAVQFQQLLEDGCVASVGGAKNGGVAQVSGSSTVILAVERTMLNWLTHLSGIATLTAQYVTAARGTGAVIVDSRKTVPTLRTLAKYAVLCGGGKSHRMGLHDAMLIKDNHLTALKCDWAAVLPSAIAAARARGGLSFVELEVDSVEQAAQAMAFPSGAIDILMVDNMSLADMRKVVQLRNASGAKVQLEASGGVSLDAVRQIAETGVDRIAVGRITHSAPALDIGLDLE